MPGALLDAENEFDQLDSSVALDEIRVHQELKEPINQHSDIFVQFGHYKTNHIERFELSAIVDAVLRLNYMYARSITDSTIHAP